MRARRLHYGNSVTLHDTLQQCGRQILALHVALHVTLHQCVPGLRFIAIRVPHLSPWEIGVTLCMYFFFYFFQKLRSSKDFTLRSIIEIGSKFLVRFPW